jgi:hypothetical protein
MVGEGVRNLSSQEVCSVRKKLIHFNKCLVENVSNITQ